MGYEEKVGTTVHSDELIGVHYIGNPKYSKIDSTAFLKGQLILSRLNIQYLHRMRT